MASASFFVSRFKTSKATLIPSYLPTHKITAKLYTVPSNYSPVSHSFDYSNSGPLSLSYFLSHTVPILPTTMGRFIFLRGSFFLNHRLNHFTLIAQKSTNGYPISNEVQTIQLGIQRPPLKTPTYLFSQTRLLVSPQTLSVLDHFSQ